MRSVVFFALILIGGYASWIKVRGLRISHDSYIGWEGFVKSKNFRDVGKSFDLCYGDELFHNGMLTRSNAWFSGWDCSAVESPDAIFTLNFNPQKPYVYFCQGDKGPVVGQHFLQTKELADLEFLETWDDPESRGVACRFLTEIMTSVVDRKRTLLHCDAGRDRTGALSGILLAMTLEPLDEKKIAAIECDYRQSHSLKPYKYGRLQNFFESIKKHHVSVSAWAKKTCEIDPNLLELFKKTWRNN